MSYSQTEANLLRQLEQARTALTDTQNMETRCMSEAEELKRQLFEVTKQRDEAALRLESICVALCCPPTQADLPRIVHETVKQRDAALAQADALRKALVTLMPFVLDDYMPDCATPEFKAAVEQCQSLCK